MIQHRLIRPLLERGIVAEEGPYLHKLLEREGMVSTALGRGAVIGTLVLTTVTATSIIFEIGGPILCKIGLQKAGEIAGREGNDRPGI